MSFTNLTRRTVLAAIPAMAVLASPLAAQEKTVRIGAILAQTGPNASIGTESLIGAEYAARKINEAGGLDIGGTLHKVEIVNIDDESKAERSVAAAEKLVAEPDIPVILTPVSSTTTLAVVPIAEKAGRLALSFVASAPPVVGPEHPLSFRSTLDTTMNVAPSVEFLVKDKGVKTIAYIGRNDDWGRSSIAQVEESAKALGAEVVMTEFFESGSTDFYGVLTKARSLEPDAVIVAAFIEDGVSLLKQFRELQMEMPLFSLGVIWASPVFLNAAGADVEGVYVATGPTSSVSPEMEAFAATFTADTGSVPLPFSTTAYDSVMLLAEAMKAAGTTEPAKLAETLRNTQYKGVLQTYAFDGDTQSDVVINVNEVKDGKVSVVSSIVVK